MTDLLYAQAEPPRGILRLTGDDRMAFLQGLVSNDMRLVSATRGIWAALLTAQGKYLHDFFVTALDDALLLEGEGGRVGDLAKRLSLYRLRSKVKIADVTEQFEVWHAWGDGAAAAFDLAGPGAARTLEGGVVLADPRLAALGLRLVLPRDAGETVLRDKGFAPADWHRWDLLRLTQGVPDGSRDLVIEKSILLESGFDELAGIAWDKGCYMGQELTARTKYRGLIKKRLMPVQVFGALPPPGTLVTRSDGSEAGEMRSGQGDRALALIRLDALTPATELSAAASRLLPNKPDWAGF